MPGFPGDFSEGLIGETEEMIELATDDLEKSLKRKLTDLEREWVRLNHTVGLQDEAEEFGRRHPNLFNRHAQTNDNTEGRG